MSVELQAESSFTRLEIASISTGTPNPDITTYSTDLYAAQKQITILDTAVQGARGEKGDTGDSLPTYFVVFDLEKNVPKEVHHDLGLPHKDALYLRTAVDGEQVLLNTKTIDENTVTIEANSDIEGVCLSIIGILTIQ